VVSAGVLGIFGVYLIQRRRKGTKAMSKKKLMAIFTSLNTNMQSVIMQIAQQEKTIRANAAQQGRKVSNEEIYEYVGQEFTQQMAQKQALIYKTHKVTESQVKKAAKKYKGDEDFEKIVGQLRTLADMLKPPSAALPSWLTEAKLLDFMGEMMEALNISVEETAEALKAQGITAESNPQQFQAAIGMKMQQRMTVINQELPKKHGITQTMVSQAMQKYSSSPTFMMVMNELQEEQRKRLAKVGVEGRI